MRRCVWVGVCERMVCCVEAAALDVWECVCMNVWTHASQEGRQACGQLAKQDGLFSFALSEQVLRRCVVGRLRLHVDYVSKGAPRVPWNGPAERPCAARSQGDTRQ